MSDKKLISIVVPCYNEQDSLPVLFQELTKVASDWEHDYEVICVDDGSYDETWQMLQDYATQHEEWKVVKFSRNFGHQPAVSAGMSLASGDCVCVIDADMQDPPRVLSEFIEKWESGYEVVYGVRRRRKDTGLKKLFAWLFYRVLGGLSSVQIPADSGDFCLLDRKVLDVMNEMPEQNRYLRGMRAWCGFSSVAVEFDRESRAYGEPQYTFRKSLKLALDGIFSFSAIPLRVASHVGVVISAVAFLGVIFTFFQRVFPDFFAQFGMAPSPGFATIVISILFLGGIQLICLGVLGEYLGRIYDEVKGRPNWVISDKCNFD